MNIPRLYEILNETTVQLRKGAVVEESRVGPVAVTEVFSMPHVDEAMPGIEKVDLEFLVIGVDKAKAEARKDELVELLRQYSDLDELGQGPSYIAVGARIGDQGAALQLFALGKVLGLWNVVTPATLGMTGAEAREAAGLGYVMITGFRP
jgi:hypothetical protein